MRSLAWLFGVVMMACGALAQTAQPASNSDIAAQLKAIEARWIDAEIHGDAAYLDTILAPDFIYTNPSAQVLNRAQLIEAVRSGKAKLESGSVSEMTVRVYGEVAVVNGTYTEHEAGSAASDAGRFTDTFVRRNGKWLAVATHSSLQPRSKARK
ncbi:MAG TPA: nuclear transport factor 2 family protein [Terriglobales bacterium]|nr:nuclear transport factor 2 family protein [Terriglobales bacterium]